MAEWGGLRQNVCTPTEVKKWCSTTRCDRRAALDRDKKGRDERIQTVAAERSASGPWENGNKAKSKRAEKLKERQAQDETWTLSPSGWNLMPFHDYSMLINTPTPISIPL
jgi:hypothetical protein